MHGLAHDARAVLDDAGVECAHVIGASMGGMIAQHLALEDPASVRSLTLACTLPAAAPRRLAPDDDRGAAPGTRLEAHVPARRPGALCKAH